MVPKVGMQGTITIDRQKLILSLPARFNEDEPQKETCSQLLPSGVIEAMQNNIS